MTQDWRLSCHPDILKLLAYWQQKCGGRLMPSRGDIKPEEIVGFLPYIILVDVVPDERRFIYRLVGTGEAQVRGNDPTGKPVGENYFAASRDLALGRYEKVCATRAPLYADDNNFQVDDRYVSEACLFLPLSENGETVNMVMVLSVNRDLYNS